MVPLRRPSQTLRPGAVNRASTTAFESTAEKEPWLSSFATPVGLKNQVEAAASVKACLQPKTSPGENLANAVPRTISYRAQLVAVRPHHAHLTSYWKRGTMPLPLPELHSTYECDDEETPDEVAARLKTESASVRLSVVIRAGLREW